MKPIKGVLAGLAATGLLVSQAAAAAPQRSSSHVTGSEKVSGIDVVGMGVIAAIAGTLVVLIATGTKDETMPVSP